MPDFETAIRLDPKEKLGYVNRAAAFKIKGDWDRAIADYSEAIQLDPNDIQMLYDRGIGYLTKRDYDPVGVGRILDIGDHRLGRDVEVEQAQFVSGLGGDRFERAFGAAALEHGRIGGQ